MRSTACSFRAIGPSACRDAVYVNTIAEDDPQRRVRGTYGDNYERLVALKNKYDPTNSFRRNANIEPTA